MPTKQLDYYARSPFSARCSVTESPDDDDDWEEPSSGSTTGTATAGGTSSEEADDDGRVYKNPRNSPSALCPRDEEQATLLVSI